jgi:hypothetical protein
MFGNVVMSTLLKKLFMKKLSIKNRRDAINVKMIIKAFKFLIDIINISFEAREVT